MSSAPKKEHFVVSNIIKKSSDKTVVVMVKRQLRHSAYGKYITRSSKLHVHDEANEGQVGDLVKIVACPRHSKTKAWRLVEVLQRAAGDTPTSLPTEQDAEVEA